ncbi:hypothetical protein DFJ74DRAFT_695653 [Hyaloraphidium curvatum]|nr:hypothetical protein DFJ74DRAFT_695653 [Hyaloraphidium curvatum]
MKITPNMLPATAGLDVNEDSFLTTDDFDSITDYTFYASFRIYFDSVSSSGQRRRRLLARDIRVPAPALRQSSRVSTDAQAALTVPPNPELPPAATTAAAPGTTATPSRVPGQLTPEEQAAIAAAQTRVVIIASVGATTSLLFLVVVAAIVFLLIARRRRSRKRNNDDGMEEKLVPPEWKDGYDKGPEGYYGGGMLAPDYAAPSGILYAGQQGMTPAGMRYY